MYKLMAHQQNFLDVVPMLRGPVRACLYFKTGAGKSLTAVLGMKELGYHHVLVIAPPSTHPQWQKVCEEHGLVPKLMSHAKFRMKDTKLDKNMAVIADEFHLFGGHKGQGWRKLDRMAQGLQAPLLLLSATPNYNDAERCYCIKHILSPHTTKGGFLQFLYENCVTKQNPFSMEPIVTGFKNYQNAAEFLADMPQVFYLEDDLVYTIKSVPYQQYILEEIYEVRYNRRLHRMIASDMELRHTVRYQGLVGDEGYLHDDVMLKLSQYLQVPGWGPVLIYCNHATIAQAVYDSLARTDLGSLLVTGSTPARHKSRLIEMFIAKEERILIGTATLATGTDGLDKVCDTLIILDDTDDDALRRQLVGRIMPRGLNTSSAGKRVLRFEPV